MQSLTSFRLHEINGFLRGLLRLFVFCFFIFRQEQTYGRLSRKQINLSLDLLINNNMEDCIIILNLNVLGCYPKTPLIKEVIWNFPLKGWIKCNIDGSAHGSPGLARCSRIFCTCLGFTKCFFLWELVVILPLKLR